MHELGIMTSVMDSVNQVARQNGATRLISVTLRIGEMTEAIEDALQFAFEVLTEGDDFTSGSTLKVNMVNPKSICLECGEEYEHDRFHMLCPNCGSFATQLLQGREMEIESIEVDIPDDDEADSPDGNLAEDTKEV